jgi:hypothetical protein
MQLCGLKKVAFCHLLSAELIRQSPDFYFPIVWIFCDYFDSHLFANLAPLLLSISPTPTTIRTVLMSKDINAAQNKIDLYLERSMLRSEFEDSLIKVFDGFMENLQDSEISMTDEYGSASAESLEGLVQNSQLNTHKNLAKFLNNLNDYIMRIPAEQYQQDLIKRIVKGEVQKILTEIGPLSTDLQEIAQKLSSLE